VTYTWYGAACRGTGKAASAESSARLIKDFSGISTNER